MFVLRIFQIHFVYQETSSREKVIQKLLLRSNIYNLPFLYYLDHFCLMFIEIKNYDVILDLY